ncbi:transglycosylase domain-containing protein [Anaerobacillus alkalilacustris]|uniref:transglycosylase domain-containing protein n=1 Tax=Anaerobacillus alkalilacustris TaxID=393763 RepID=UPI003CCBC87E
MSLLGKSIGFFLVLIFISVFSFSFIGFSNELSQIQTVESLLEEKVTTNDFSLHDNSYIYDSNGNIISEIYKEENRIYISYDEIPTYFIEAIIATEDRHFFSHKGFDITGIARAFLVNAENQSIEQGGSTLTQQLVKNIYLTNDRTYNRKLTELLYAFQIEKMFSKEKILELYLNAIFFQNGVYGIEAASQFYLSRSVSELSLAEVAYLLAIPNNPTHYNPFINPGNTTERKNWILAKMLELQFITKEQHNAARDRKITLNPSKKIDLYPDYVTYIHYEFEQLVGEKEGYNQKIERASTNEHKNQYISRRKKRVEELLSSGIHIHSSLQPKKQENIYQVIAQRIPNQSIQGAAVIIDHRSNNIVAISGGKQYKKFDLHRGFQAFRQPGSSIKSLLVFAPYLSERNSSINNFINASAFCKNGYCPRNYGGATYGNVRLETAFKHSYNTAAVRMLDQIGIETAFSYFFKLGFTKIVEEDFNLPSALGGLTYGVSPLEMTTAYTTFANEGMFQKARGIEKVLDANGKVLLEWDKNPQQVWNKETNSKMRSLLNKVITEGTARKAYYNSGNNFIGGKTGTTNTFHDLWFIGLNEEYTTGVWVGYDQPKSLAHINSRAPHLLIWRDLMGD